MSSEFGASHPVFRLAGLSYVRIPAPDPVRSATFYRAVFGWTVDVDREDPSFEDGTGHVIGHFMESVPVSTDGGFVPYVFVEDVGETLGRVAENGGEVIEHPYLEGNLGVATFRDPAGNLVGVWQQGPLD
jgi:uncharacterized protein